MREILTFRYWVNFMRRIDEEGDRTNDCGKVEALYYGNSYCKVRMVNYKISVIGEVARPGTFTISNEKVNILEALAMAGDMTVMVCVMMLS